MARILIVEDDPEFVGFLERVLTEAGHQTRSVADGRAAQRAAQSMEPDLVILDLFLPKMDGVEIYANLQLDPKTGSVPILVLTAAAEYENSLRDIGAEYRLKPIRRSEILEAVGGLLASAENRT